MIEKDDDAMTQVMTPSEMTIGQISKIQENLGAALRKAGLPQEPSQIVLETQGDAFIAECVSAFRKRVEAQSDLIIRRVNVDRLRLPKAALEATARKLYVNDSVVADMPKGEGEDAEVVFFKVGRYVSDADLDKEYELRGLKPADPYSLAAVNEADPAFAEDHPNGTHWKDSSDKWCCALFYRWYDERHAFVYRRVSDWHGGWWFAGLRK